MEVALSETPEQKTMTVIHTQGLGYVCANCDTDATLLAESKQMQPIAQEETSPAHANLFSPTLNLHRKPV